MRGIVVKSSSSGFSIVELLVVVVVIGVIAAIAIPTMINGLDRGRQKRTMADLRTIGAAIQSYVVDNDLYPTAANVVGLASTLHGDYIERMPLEDAWGNGFVYLGAATGYTVGSPGKDGGTSLLVVGGSTGDFDDDIVYANGSFVQWPDGMQN